MASKTDVINGDSLYLAQSSNEIQNIDLLSILNSQDKSAINLDAMLADDTQIVFFNQSDYGVGDDGVALGIFDAAGNLEEYAKIDDQSYENYNNDVSNTVVIQDWKLFID